MSAPTITLGGRPVGSTHPAYVIAEIGINFEGDATVCARMVEASADAGADAVKLQTADPDEHYAPDTESHAIYRRAMLTQAETADIFALARARGIDVFTTCGDPPTLAFVETLDPVAHKISSGMVNHVSMIRRFAATGRPIILSTGMSELPQIDRAVEAARSGATTDLAVLHCVSLYPAPAALLNLRAIRTLGARYNVPAGFSDHTQSLDVPVHAVAAGASLIEKHVSLDPSRSGFDHRVSVTPDELGEIVRRIRALEAMLGSGEKVLSEPERAMARNMRRAVVARRRVGRDTVLAEADLQVARIAPGRPGLGAECLEATIGRRVNCDLEPYTPIVEEMLG